MVSALEFQRLTGIDQKTLHDIVNPLRIESNREELRKLVDEYDVVTFKPVGWLKRKTSDLIAITGNYEPYLKHLLSFSDILVYPREPKRASLEYHCKVVFSCQEEEIETSNVYRIIKLDPKVVQDDCDCITTPNPELTARLGLVLLERTRRTIINVSKME